MDQNIPKRGKVDQIGPKMNNMDLKRGQIYQKWTKKYQYGTKIV